MRTKLASSQRHIGSLEPSATALDSVRRNGHQHLGRLKQRRSLPVAIVIVARVFLGTTKTTPLVTGVGLRLPN